MPLDDGTELARLLRTYHRQLVDQAVTAAADAIGYRFDLELEQVQDVLDQLAKRIVNVAGTTRERVRELAGQAAREGWSPQEFAARLVETGLFGPERALLIARTEAATAYTQGAILYYRESGQVERLEWLLGPEPCPECQPYGGTTAALAEGFTGGAMVPLHPNCTCAVLPVISSRTE
jgi:hypothetical protein